MEKYIDADVFERVLLGLGEDVICDDCCMVVLDRLNKVPAADVEPKRKTGWWIPGNRFEYDGHGETVRHPGGITCSQCRYSFEARPLWSRDYCPHCGSRMLPEPPKEEDDV